MTSDHRYPCPCCGFFTLSQPPPGTYGLCPVCYWEDDLVQFENPDYEGGANAESLNMARSNFARFGASSMAAVDVVRPPTEDEREPSATQ